MSDSFNGKKIIASMIVTVCAAGAGVGFVSLVDYSLRPGKAAVTNAAARIVSPDTADRVRLVLFLHPQCPCSRATLHELELLTRDLPAGASLEIYFYRPDNQPHSWVETDIWRRSLEIPNAVLGEISEDGLREFGVATSGQVLMFDHGRLVFSGGITKMRAHEGDNAGSQLIRRHLSGELTELSESPVFGCIMIDAP